MMLGFLLKTRDFFAKTGNLQNLGIFCKNREFLQKPGIYKSRDFLQKPGIYKSRDFLQKPGIYKSRYFWQKPGIFTGFLYKITRFFVEFKLLLTLVLTVNARRSIKNG